MPARIGLTTSFENGTQQLDRRYVTAIEEAGGQPLLLPTTADTSTVDGLLDLLDGLVVPGGPAVVEGCTGSLPKDLAPPSEQRAAADRCWMRRCWRTGRPILGICYGMQQLNALAGGTLYADVEADREETLTHSHARGGTSHTISLAAGSQLRRWLGTDALVVNTRHFQALATLGDGFSVAATAPDGVVEAIEHETGRLWGVQFHPERLGPPAARIFRAFVQQAASSPPA